MRLVTFLNDDGAPRPGVLTDRGVIDLTSTLPEHPCSLRKVLAGGMLKRAADLIHDSSTARIRTATLTAPIQTPTNVIGIGLNYRDHAIESGMAIPDEPIVFGKFSSTVIGPDEAILLPSESQEVDFEAELVVVIGRRPLTCTSLTRWSMWLATRSATMSPLGTGN